MTTWQEVIWDVERRNRGLTPISFGHECTKWFLLSSHVRSCHNCQLVKPLKVKERQPLEPITIRTDTWDDISIDRKMRGLLAVVRDKWENDITEPTPGNFSTLKYMQDLQHKIQTALNSAQDNVTTAQKRMKDHYDKKSSERQFEPGDLVMILLPTSSNYWQLGADRTKSQDD